MNQDSAGESDKVTILVFKDNYAARTFQVPLGWISKLGILLGILLGSTILSVFIAAKYYRVASRADLARVQDLEQELSDLKDNLKILESKSTTDTIPIVSTKSSVTTLPPKEAQSPGQALVPTPDLMFSGLPGALLTQLPDPSTLPFAIQTPKTTWRGKTLNIHFALQYIKEDQGTQQGKILIFARGPESLLAYPAGILNRVGSENFVAPEKGEFFSMSRYREVSADFGPMRSRELIQDIEILILNNESKILAYHHEHIK